jgi:S-methylmethionine-dependent homocysteine/selenocysteine methylase
MPPAAPAAGKPRNRRARLWLAMGAGIVALLCLGGVGVFISLYDEATEIDRATPDQVTSSFLRAYLVNRNDEDADLFSCAAGGDFAELKAFRDEMAVVEQQHSVGIRVSWGSLTVAADDSQGTVTTEVTRTATDSARLSDRWQFGVVNENGWRVCSATKLS